MYLPNYKDGSIVNMMASIEKAIGGKPMYKSLKAFKPRELKKAKNIVLIVIDGLGYDYLMKYGKGTILQKNLRGKMTSVFPSTTATAIPAFLTGVPAQQHGLTGWYVFLKEFGIVSIILWFVSKLKEHFPNKSDIDPRKIFTQKPIFEKIKIDSYHVSDQAITKLGLNSLMYKKAKNFSYKTGSLNEFFKQIKKAITSNNKRKYVYAYWLELDNLIHHNGTRSKKAHNHVKEIDKKLGAFIKSIKGSNSTIIITSDHGFIDSPKSKTIDLKNHPVLQDALTLPLCGEARVSYCYVHPSKAKQFEKYVKTKLKHACYLYKSQDLIKKNFFGLFKPNKNLFDRIGDYVLIMKDNYLIKQGVLNKKANFMKSNHGGVTKEEMFVPLIIIKK